MEQREIKLSDDQRRRLETLWFIYGNNGKKHSHCNHRYIQNFLEHGQDTEGFYKKAKTGDLTEECINEVKKVVYE